MAALHVVALSPGARGLPTISASVAIVHPLASVEVLSQAPKFGAGTGGDWASLKEVITVCV